MSNQKDGISIIMGDFNARSSSWCRYDISNNEGVQIDSVTSIHGLEQLIYEPTHILSNSSQCIDLIFTDQPNLLVDSGTHPSLHPNCHHQTIHCKTNLQVKYPHLIKDMFGIMLKLIRIPFYLHCKMLINIVCLLIRLFINK